jgi:hypothetical protein
MTRDELYQRVYHHLAGKLTCREMTEAITDYLEGTLGFWRWVRFQMHLGLCLGCRIHLRQMKYTVRTLGRLPAGSAPPAVRLEMIQRFRTWKSA